MKLITENRLDGWVDTHEQDARGIVVDLVARLVSAQCPAPKHFRFPRADSIGQQGSDGCLTVSEAYPPYIPEGTSVWEIGSNEAPQKKATSDYNSARKRCPIQIRSNTTFVFVTPRSAYHTQWTSKKQDAWKQKRKNDGWKDIIILDGTALADWLEHLPAVAAWLYSAIYGVACDIEIPKTRWEDIESIPSLGNRRLTPSLFLCGREELISQIDDFLSSGQLRLTVQTHHPDHLIDFISAFIQSKQAPEQGKFYSDVIILKNAADLKKFASLETPHVFVLGEEGDPDNMPKLCSNVARHGHKIILPRNVGGKADHSSPILRMPPPHAIQMELEEAGFTALEAQSLSAKSNGNLPCLLRLLSQTYGHQYGTPGQEQILALVSLIGAWDEKNCEDLQLIEELTGKTYEEWKKELALLPKQAAAPLRHRDDGIYYFISRYEGWNVGGGIFTQEELERFFLIAEKVLVTVAHSSFANPIQRILANENKDTACPSDTLALAVAEMLAIMASNARYWAHGSTAWLENRIAALVSSLLDNASIDIWRNLGTTLPLLAEAAPHMFLRQLSAAVTSNSFLGGLAVKKIDPFTASPIVAILWSLECLAWSPDWFPQAVALLGDLAEVTMPENSGNRPDASLAEIFNIWNPHTCTDISNQAKHLERIAKSHPLTAWRIILAIAPHAHGCKASFGTYMPHWREFKQHDQNQHHGITWDEWLQKFESLTSLALSHLLLSNIVPLEELIKGITAIPQKLDEILGLFKSRVNTSEQKHAWELLSSFLRWVDNREYLKEKLALITEVVNLLTPSDKYEQLKIYFNDSIPEYDNGKTFEDQFASWQKKQQEVVAEIFRDDGLNGVLRFTSLVKTPGIVGQELAKICTSDTDFSLLVTPAIPAELSETAARIFSRAYIEVRYSQGGDAWLNTLWNALSPTGKLEVLLSLPFHQATWNFVKKLPEELQKLYWKQALLHPGGTPADIEYPLQNLMAAGRNGEALQWLYWNLRKNITPSITTVKELLLHPDEHMVRQSHVAIEMIEYLRKQLQTCDDDLARIELCWRRQFHSSKKGDKKPDCLNRKLLTDSGFFVDALNILYKPRHQEETPVPVDENIRFFSEMFYHALDGLTPPEGFAFSNDTFAAWLDEVLKLARETDRYEVACLHIGNVLFYAEKDPGGLWIDKRVATILNVREYEDMRRGFHSESINSRGFYWGSEGIEEQNIAQTYRGKAAALRNEGFFNFAECVDSIAKDYEQQAQMEKDLHLRDF